MSSVPISCEDLEAEVSFIFVGLNEAAERCESGRNTVLIRANSASSRADYNMKLDATDLRYISSDAFRVLAAVSLQTL